MQGFLHYACGKTSLRGGHRPPLARNLHLVKSSPSASATEIRSASRGSTSSLPATIVSAADPLRIFGLSERNSSSTRSAANRNELSVGPPSHSTQRTPCCS